MFKISIATPSQIDMASDYLGYIPKGLAMVCIEDGKLTGACELDIKDGFGILGNVKTDKLAMEPVVASAGLNFLDLQGVQYVYSNIQDNSKVHMVLGFKMCSSGIIEPSNGYLVKLNLKGYFEVGKCGGH